MICCQHKIMRALITPFAQACIARLQKSIVTMKLKSVGLLWVTIFVSQASVQAQENDWPCAQVLVPSVSAAVIWPYVLDDSIKTRWVSNAQVKSLAGKLSGRYTVGETELAMIEQFFSDQNSATQSELATDLFLATLNELNVKRQKYIKGIQKFTHKQKTLAQRLTALLEQRDELSPDDQAQEALFDDIAIVEQIFRNRETIIIDLCEQPVRVEENLGMLAREIASYVE